MLFSSILMSGGHLNNLFNPKNDVIKRVLFKLAYCEQPTFSKKKHLFLFSNANEWERKNELKRFSLQNFQMKKKKSEVFKDFLNTSFFFLNTSFFFVEWLKRNFVKTRSQLLIHNRKRFHNTESCDINISLKNVSTKQM